MTANKLTIEDVDIKGKRVIIRVDYNVPQDEQGNITDDQRIRQSLPTINYALNQQAKVILMSHLGRPKGKVSEKFSLKPIAKRLGQLLGQEVKMADDCLGESVKNLVADLSPEDVVMLENLRFHKEEEANDLEFARELASLADVYIDDAFGAVHRAHASIAAITQFFQQPSCGFLLDREIKHLSQVLSNPERPFYLVLGGAKVSTKIGVIDHLLDKIDGLLIGGGMAYTFLNAHREATGNSLLEQDQIETVAEILVDAHAYNIPILLPTDHLVAKSVSQDAETMIVNDIPDGWIAVDIGPQTIKRFTEAINQAKTIFWNGDMGVFELKGFERGTEAIAKAIADSKATTIAGGGDTILVIDKLGLSERFTHISTGGGACLEFLEGKDLPGISCLKDKF